MGYTTEDLATVREAILALATGERVVSVTIRGRTTQYSQVSLPDLRALAAEIEGSVSGAGAPRPIRVIPRDDRR